MKPENLEEIYWKIIEVGKNYIFYMACSYISDMYCSVSVDKDKDALKYSRNLHGKHREIVRMYNHQIEEHEQI